MTTPDPAVTVFLLTDDDLHLSAGILPGYDPTDPICGACRERETFGVVFGIVADGVTGRLCADCAEHTGPLGEALADLADGLESIAAAAGQRGVDRTALLRLAAQGVAWLQAADTATAKTLAAEDGGE